MTATNGSLILTLCFVFVKNLKLNSYFTTLCYCHSFYGQTTSRQLQVQKKIMNSWSLRFIAGKCDNKKFRYQSVKTCNEEFEGHAKAALQKAGAIPRGDDLRKLCE